MVVMLERELIVWGRSPVKELNETSLEQVIDILVAKPWIEPTSIISKHNLHCH